MKRRRFLQSGLASFVAGGALANDMTAVTVVAGDRFSMGGQAYLLADITAPSIYSLGADRAPFASEAAGILADLIGRRKIVTKETAPPSRWGEAVVTAYIDGDDLSLQEHMVLAGAARVAPQTDNNPFIDRLFGAEHLARTKRRGLWALGAYNIFDANDAEGAIGAFHLIEGVVVRAAKTRSRFYLNFGEDYRTDFTASAQSRIYKKWLRASFDLAAFEGKRVRIRGFVNDINGPSIELAHVRQIENRDEKTGAL